MDFPTEEQAKKTPDHTQRIDSKLKGDIRPPLEDLWPPDMCGGELGFNARNMRVYPRYVMLGKPYFKLKSKFQLVPAGPWRDPREFLEDEDDATRELPFYRITTLPFGIKTVRQKNEEKKRKDLKENEQLFGNVTDKTHNQTKRKRIHRTYLTRSKRRTTKKSQETSCKVIMSSATGSYYEGSKDDLKDEDEEEEDDDDDDDDATDSSSGMVNEDDASSGPSTSRKRQKAVVDEEEQRSCVASKKRKCVEGDMVLYTPATEQCEQPRSPPATKQPPRPALRSYKVNRRFPRLPIKNRMMRKVSFFDCSYWQKFQFCCFDLYAGEGGLVVTRLYDMKGKLCPVWEKQMARRQRAKERLQQQLVEVDKQQEVHVWQSCDGKDTEPEGSCLPFAENVCQAFAEEASRQPSVTESASECSQSLEESSDDASGGEQSSTTSKEACVGAAHPRYTPSPPLSSGGDDRGNVTSSPVLEKALTDPMFHWAPAQLGYRGLKKL